MVANLATVHQPPTGRFFCAILSAVQKNTMTATAKQLTDKIASLRTHLAWTQQEIWIAEAELALATSREQQDTPLFDEVFGG